MTLLVSLLAASVVLCIPVMVAALGEMVSERAGVLNIGIEGVMLSGAFAAALAFQNYQSFPLAIVTAIFAGAICWLILGALYLWRQTEQIGIRSYSNFIFSVRLQCWRGTHTASTVVWTVNRYSFFRAHHF
jgi:ABC-type uncharacterized transport system permease subunit